MSSSRRYVQWRLHRGHFFAAIGRAHAISPPPAASRPDMMLSAGVAELVDALDLGSSDESRGGSSPSARTTLRVFPAKEAPDVGAGGRVTRPECPIPAGPCCPTLLCSRWLIWRFHSATTALQAVRFGEAIGPQGPDEARLAVQQFTQRLWDLDDDVPCGLAEPPTQASGPRVDQIDNVPAFRPDQAGRRLTPCR